MGAYEDIEKMISDIEKFNKNLKKDKTVKVCVRIPEKLMFKMKANKLCSDYMDKPISIQDQIVIAIKQYLKVE